MTGYGQESDKKAAKEAGFNDHLVKPISTKVRVPVVPVRDSMDNAGIYSFAGINEPVSCLTHLVGAGVFTLLALSLIRRGRGNWGRSCCSSYLRIFGGVLLVVSGLYHLCPPETSSRIRVLWRLRPDCQSLYS